MAAAATTTTAQDTSSVPPLAYSGRVQLKELLDRSEAAVGQRVVVGGWVKSAKEVEKTAPPPSIATTDDTAREGGKGKDVSCVEILQSRIPLLRSLLDVFGGGGYVQRKKRENVIVPNHKVLPPKASTAYLLLTDGSCVPSLQVRSHHCALFGSALFVCF